MTNGAASISLRTGSGNALVAAQQKAKGALELGLGRAAVNLHFSARGRVWHVYIVTCTTTW